MICCFCFALPAWAQTIEINKTDIERLLQEWQSLMPVREELQVLGFTGKNLDLASKHVSTINSDPLIVSHIADLIVEAYENPAEIVVQPEGFILPLVDRGMGHLSTSELVYFYKVERAIIEALPPRTCGRLVMGRLPPAEYNRVVAGTAARLNTPALKEYYRLQHKAARFGATLDPVLLSDQHRKQIEDKIKQGVEDRIQGRKDTKKLQRALDDPKRATLKQACELSRLYVHSALGLKGKDLRDSMIFLSAP